MTDGELARATVEVNVLEQTARALHQTSTGDERDAAQLVVRQAVALRRALESWIVRRATRAQ